MSDITSHHENKELFLLLSVNQKSPFPAGDYVIKYAVNDDVSGDSFEIVKDVVISIDGGATFGPALALSANRTN